jgi:hypothetical protein
MFGYSFFQRNLFMNFIFFHFCIFLLWQRNAQQHHVMQFAGTTFHLLIKRFC